MINFQNWARTAFATSILASSLYSQIASAQLASRPLSKQLACEGPGFDYAKLEITPQNSGYLIKASHHFFDLSINLRKVGLIGEEDLVREIEFFATSVGENENSACRQAIKDKSIVYCTIGDFVTVKAKDYQGRSLADFSASVHRLSISRTQSLDYLEDGLDATLWISVGTDEAGWHQADEHLPLKRGQDPSPVHGIGCKNVD